MLEHFIHFTESCVECDRKDVRYSIVACFSQTSENRVAPGEVCDRYDSKLRNTVT
ncbi:hypothetical protein [Nostoc sp.]|uniref:hypothetical protein n=1 Tax=Nostoc sp. TaxID=1180 RepID=UPI002FFADA17